MGINASSFLEELRWRGVSRREFLGYCSAAAAALSLPRSAAAQIAEALANKPKPTVVWCEYQSCTGNSESLLRGNRPSASEVILDMISLDYAEVLMAAAGHQAEHNLHEVVTEKKGEYIAIIEGSIPTGANGSYCVIGGKSAIDTVKEVCENAAATIAIGSCAAFGGLPAAAPNPTGALSVADAVPGLKNLIALSACPANVENLTALLAYYLTFERWPPLDQHRRPLFAYGKTIHDNCERRAHFDAGQFVEMWGDEAHRAGYCLYKVGCKGPQAYQNCPNVEWNSKTNWPVGCGHGCIGCSEPDFWDKYTPFYSRIEGVPGFETAQVGNNVDVFGGAAAVGVFGAMGVHSLLQLSKKRVETRSAERAASAAAAAGHAKAQDENKGEQGGQS